MASSLPPLYALRAFESAARTGSFTLAAEELHLTPSAVSKHIKTLEQHFGCRLFQRNGPRIEVTPQGKIFAAELQQGFGRIEQACELFRSHRDLLRLKAPSTLTMRWLLDCLSRFRQTAQAFDVQAASVWMDIDSVDFFQRTLRLRHPARQRPFRRQYRRRQAVRRMAGPDLRPRAARRRAARSRRLPADPPFARSARLAALAAKKRHRGPVRSCTRPGI